MMVLFPTPQKKVLRDPDMQVFSPQPETGDRTTTTIRYWPINAPQISSHRTAQPRARGDIEGADAD
jgi:hypothetical protein